MKNPFIWLHLLSNGAETYISITDIQQIYCDTSGEGKEGTKIIFNNDTYTMVGEDLDDVMYRIDNVYDPDFYKDDMPCEESKTPILQEVVTAAEVLKKYCKAKKSCAHCPFCSEEYHCQIGMKVPSHWEIEEEDE